MKNIARGVIAAAFITVVAPGLASAAPAPAGAPSAADIASVKEVLAGADTHKRLAETTFPGSAAASVNAAAAGTADASRAVAVYEPSADFIRGTSATPAELAYVAAPATTGDGAPATVWAQRQGTSWKVFNVASGDYESQYAGQADGGYLLHEPQVNAWYSVQGDTVRVIDGGVTKAAKGTTMSVASYQADLSSRYGDKLPGSTYDRTGAAGGYGPTINTQAAPAEDVSTNPVLLLAGGVVLLAGAGVVTARRLRKN